MPEIELRGLSKAYVPDEYAVADLDLTIPDRSFVCLLGPSGCGKTTTLRMIAGLEEPNAGRIEVGGRVLDEAPGQVFVPPEARNLGFMFQSYALWPHMTVERNIAFGLQLQGVPRSEIAQRVERMLDLLEVGGLGGRYASELSGGQQQRVALARMLAMDPAVWLMDEPLSNLDAALRLTMRSELKRLHQELESTVVFVTHDQSEAMSMATHIAVMKDGRIQQLGEPMEIYRRPATRFVANFIGSPPMNMLDPRLVRRDGDGPHILDAVAASDRAGSPVATVGIRPEDVVLDGGSLAGGSSNGHLTVGQGTVETVLPTGYEYIVSLEVGANRLFAISREGGSLRPGQSVPLNVDEAAIHLFGEDEMRIEPTARAAGHA